MFDTKIDTTLMSCGACMSVLIASTSEPLSGEEHETAAIAQKAATEPERRARLRIVPTKPITYIAPRIQVESEGFGVESAAIELESAAPSRRIKAD